MSDDSDKNRKPLAIYFDTNALIDAKHVYTSSWFVSCLRFAQHLSVGLYVPKLVLDECDFILREKAGEAISQIEKNLGILESMRAGSKQKNKAAALEGFGDEIPDLHRSRLSDMGIQTISNYELPLATLLEQAVRRDPPFGEADKGFRDTVIIESMANHAKSLSDDAFVWIISSDKAWQRSRHRFEQRNVKALILPPKEVPDRIEAVSMQAGMTAWLQRREAAKTHVQPSREDIFNAISKAKISLTLLDSDFDPDSLGRPSLLQNISRLHDVRPLEIVSVDWPAFAPDLDESEVSKDRTIVDIRVKTEFDVEIDRYGPLRSATGRRVVPLDKRGPLSSIEEVLPLPESPRYEDRTLTREISVLGSIKGDPDHPVPRKDFKVVRVRG